MDTVVGCAVLFQSDSRPVYWCNPTPEKRIPNPETRNPKS